MLQQLFDFFKWLYDFVIDSILNGVISILSSIPVPDFLSNITSTSSAIGGQTAYYLGLMRVDDGIVIILGALVLRFILRRIPFIG